MPTFLCIFFRNADNNFFLPEVISAVTYPIATFVFSDTRVMTQGFKHWLRQKPSNADYLCKPSIAKAIELYAMAYYAI